MRLLALRGGLYPSRAPAAGARAGRSSRRLVCPAVLAGSLVVAATSAAALTATSGLGARVVVSAITASTPHVGSSRTFAAAYAAGATIMIAGQVADAPSAGVASLEQSQGGAWRVQARAAIRAGGAFTLEWMPTASGPVTVRVALRSATGRLLAATASQNTRVLTAVCAIPQLPQAAPGDGLIVGGLYVAGPYLEGGALNPTTGKSSLTPKPLGCDWQPYTVTISGNGTTQTAAAGANGGYAIAVPAGAYTLTATYNAETCRGSGTVTAGQQTEIDTYCGLLPVP
jgi:hypothetical protein